MARDAQVTLKVQSWDKECDGKQVRVKLPKEITVGVTIEDDDVLENIHEYAMDAASDETGFCINSCTMENIKLL